MEFATCSVFANPPLKYTTALPLMLVSLLHVSLMLELLITRLSRQYFLLPSYTRLLFTPVMLHPLMVTAPFII